MYKVLILILSSMLLTGCAKALDIPSLNHELNCMEVVYNGKEHKLEYHNELNDTTVVYENNKHIDAGVYEVKAIFTKEEQRHESTANLTIKPYEYNYLDLEFNNKVLYDGNYHHITYNEDIIPSDVNVYFEFDNNYKEVGVYNNTLIIESNNSNIQSNKIDVTFEVLENIELEVINSKFDNIDFVYNYEIQFPILSNHSKLIEYGYNIEYINEESINVGDYNIAAIITKEKFIHTINHEYTIEPKEIKPELIINQDNNIYNFDVDLNVTADKVLKFYNVNDLNNEIGRPSQYGDYLLKVEFSNYNENYIINNIEHYFSIELNNYEQSLINNAYLNEYTYDYDGKYKQATISNHRDLVYEGFIIIYTYNNQEEPPKEIGNYIVDVTIIKNNKVIKTLSSNLIIK